MTPDEIAEAERAAATDDEPLDLKTPYAVQLHHAIDVPTYTAVLVRRARELERLLPMTATETEAKGLLVQIKKVRFELDQLGEAS